MPFCRNCFFQQEKKEKGMRIQLNLTELTKKSLSFLMVVSGSKKQERFQLLLRKNYQYIK